MSLSDRDKMEMAEVFATVLDSRLAELNTQIAAGFVEIMDWTLSNLAEVFESRGKEALEVLIQKRKEELKRNPVKGFTP